MPSSVPKRYKHTTRRLGGIGTWIHVWIHRGLIAAVLAILAVAVVSQKERLSWEKQVYPLLLDSMVPVLNGFDYIKDKTAALCHDITDYIGLREKNTQLTLQLEQLGQYYLAYEQAKMENTELKTLLHYAPELHYDYITSRVVGMTSGPWTHVAMVTAGSKNGVEKGQVVVNERGLVGRITDVGEHASRILLISDSSSRIPVVTARSHERGMVAGTNSSEKMQLLYLADNSSVEQGELVFSSGDGDLLPPGIVVGAVREVHGNEVTVAPSVRFDMLEFVKIVRY